MVVLKLYIKRINADWFNILSVFMCPRAIHFNCQIKWQTLGITYVVTHHIVSDLERAMRLLGITTQVIPSVCHLI